MFLILRLQIWLDSAGNQPAKKKKTQQFLRDYTDIGGGGIAISKLFLIIKNIKQKTCSLTIFTIDYKELD